MKRWKATRIGNKLIIKFTLVCFTLFLLTIIVSYFTLVPPLQKQAIDNAKNVNRQIVEQTDLLLSDVKNYAENVPYDIGFLMAYEDYSKNPGSDRYYQLVCQNLNRLAGMSNQIRNITVQSKDEKESFTSIVQMNQPDADLLKSDWYCTLHQSDYASGFSTGYRVNDDTDGAAVYSAAYCKNFYVFSKWFTVTVFFKCNSVLDISESLATRKLNNQIWTDSTYTPLFPLKQDEWSNIAIKKLKDKAATATSFFEAANGYNFVQYSEQSDWAFVSYVSRQALQDSYKSYLFMIISIFLALFVIIVLTMPFLITSITKPIGSLEKTMTEVSKGNLDVVSTVHTNDEIGELSKIFNSMVDDLKIHIDQLFEKEELEQRMKYSLLISQIDPHFIYNTMNSINVLARRERCADIIEINTALIKILQDRLRVRNIAVFDTVEQEISVLMQYVVIQNYRYENRINVTWDISKEMYPVKIPKNIIQPLVENAFFHGMIDENGEEINGHIDISIKRENSAIVIRVSDDGNGIEPEKLKQLNSTHPEESQETRGRHIGLVNLRERLAFLYGNVECMRIESSLPKGICITITLKEQIRFLPNEL